MVKKYWEYRSVEGKLQTRFAYYLMSDGRKIRGIKLKGDYWIDVK